MLVSVLIPSRDRVDILKNSISSLLDNAKNSDRIEILVKFDFDDVQTITRFNSLTFRKQDKVLFGERFRGYKDHYLFLNDLAKLSTGEFLFTWNDDTTMMSKDWDEEISNYSSQFVVLKPQHNMSTLQWFNGNPIYPKKWVEICGHVAMNCHTDNWIHDIATELGIQKEAKMIIRNDAKHWGGFVDDQTYRQGSIFQYDHQDYYGLEKTRLREYDKEQIKNYLNTCKK
ncbi:hypothetical protein M0P65_06685 [Candidatus Gracilibacteria bacterium]|jgi:hypothetical protein|nr:hypothetical protein [Candidatus Gracilibacteria bacterium]